MSRLLPSVSSWSAAAGRYGSAATSNGRRPSLTTWRASLAVEVVLPEPWRPTMATTAGLPDRWNVRSPADSRSTSSSLTILTTCWPADRLSSTSWPMAFSRTRATKSLTTLKLTSASSSASRTSRMAASTSASLIRPRPVRVPSVLRSRSLRVSNMVRVGTPDGWLARTGDGRSGGARVLTHRAGGVYRRPFANARRTEVPATLCSAVVRNPFASAALAATAPSSGCGARPTISIFGSLITRMALPLAAILILGSGAFEVAVLRGLELGDDARLRTGRRGVGRPTPPPAGPDLGRPRAGRSSSARSRSRSRSAS